MKNLDENGHCKQCPHCSNFMNWQRLWGHLWRCLNCGSLSDGRTGLDRHDLDMMWAEARARATAAMADYDYQRREGRRPREGRHGRVYY